MGVRVASASKTCMPASGNQLSAMNACTSQVVIIQRSGKHYSYFTQSVGLVLNLV